MQDNLKLPAYPLPLVSNPEGEIKDASDWEGPTGFTKLEKAALIIAQGIVSNGDYVNKGEELIAADAVVIAKAVLEEANK